MTPTEAYRAALEAAATIADGMKAPIQDAANIAIGLPAFSKTVAALIRAFPVPDGLDDICPRCAKAGGLDDTDELDRLRAENERLRAALMFYAAESNWKLKKASPRGLPPAVLDSGSVARATVQYGIAGKEAAAPLRAPVGDGVTDDTEAIQALQPGPCRPEMG